MLGCHFSSLKRSEQARGRSLCRLSRRRPGCRIDGDDFAAIGDNLVSLDLASDGSGNRERRLRADPFGAEDGLLVDETPLAAVLVGQLCFDKGRLRLISYPAHDLTSDFWHLQMMARPELGDKSSGSVIVSQLS